MVQSVWDYLVLRARLGPHELAVHAPRGPVSRLTLISEVAGLATDLLEQGVAGEGMVGLGFENSYLHLLLVLALDRLDVPTTSLPIGLEPAALAEFARACGVTTLITSEPAPADSPCRWIRMPDPHRPRIGNADRARLSAIAPRQDSLLRVIWSSGTTGSPKGTPLTRARQMCRLEAVNRLRGQGSTVRHFLAMPLGTVYGYNVALGLLMSGNVVVLPGSNTLLELVDSLGINATGVSVAMLRDLIGPRPDVRRPIERMRIDVMGSSLPPKLAQEARYLLTPRLTLIYGTTEATTIATGDAALCIADPCAVGFPVPWVEAEIVDESDSALPAGREGILRVRGPHIADCYYRDDAATTAMFRAGWFYPGEIGIIAEGLLRVTGRLSESIRRDDALIGPVPIEAALAALPGVREAAVFPLSESPGSGEQIAAALVLEPGADLAGLQAVMSAKLGPLAPTRLISVSQLPRNQNGKVLKGELQARVRAAAEASL